MELGVDSLGIVAIISIFVGAVVTIQTALNIEDPLIPDYYIAIATRESIVLEFSPTIVSLILAGKVGSNIASSIQFYPHFINKAFMLWMQKTHG